jgi:hypothetical protein
MNYLASLILIGVEFDEALAFTILTKLMENDGYKLASLYEHNLSGLFEFAE